MSSMSSTALQAANHLWAKTRTDPAEPGSHATSQWLPLPVHLRDTAEIARLLVRHRMSPQQRRLTERTLPADTDLEALAWLLGSLHDVGKSGPAFQGQVTPMAVLVQERTRALLPPDGLHSDRAQPVASQSEFPHSLASEVIVARVLAEDYGMTAAPVVAPSFGGFTSRPVARPLPVARQLASVLGSHHGMTAPLSLATNFLYGPTWTEILGSSSSPWHEVQRALTVDLINESLIDASTDAWSSSDLHIDTAVLSLLTGLVIQADWIASNTDLFPLIDLDQTAEDCAPSTERAERAWTALGLPERWSAAPAQNPDQSVRDRFSLPADAAARPGQVAAFEATRDVREPALVILTDLPGSGKTEAALIAAENLAAATGATGLFFGLPTMATANAIFTRVTRWLSAVPTKGDGARVSTGLAHSKASLNREFRGLGPVARSGSAGREGSDGLPTHADVSDVTDSHESQDVGSKILRPGTHEWLGGRKKRLLADFVVGTVDQVLMAALSARHVMLRHSGLADKVVILDEVHAADSTMKVFLRHALVWLGRWGVPTIVLTATLPPQQRENLITAYRQGLRMQSVAELPGSDVARPSSHTDEELVLASDESAAYPALTCVTRDSVSTRPVEGPASCSVELRELPDSAEDLVRVLSELGQDGGCIAVIRNSVTRVQATARILRGAFGDDAVTVAHARYAAVDRAAKDQLLLDRYGRDSTDRPHFSIVVSSQVAEQSLDIDFDALITDMCPVDLLIQRIGRVHRHAGRTRPRPVSGPVCYVTGVREWAADPPLPVPDSEAVYGRHHLLRSIAAVRARCGTTGVLTTPDDVMPLVNAVYGGGQVGPESWQDALSSAAAQQDEKDRALVETAERWAITPQKLDGGLDGWLNVSSSDPEDIDPYNRERGRVRDGAESIEVLLVLTDGTGWRTLDWHPEIAGRPIPDVGHVPSSLAEAIATSSVRLPYGMSHAAAGDRVIADLETLGRANFQKSPLLRGQLVLPLTLINDGYERPSASATVGGWHVSYNPVDGLDATRVRADAGHSPHQISRRSSR